MPSQKGKRPKFGEAWKNIKTDPVEMDDLFSKFVKQPPKPRVSKSQPVTESSQVSLYPQPTECQPPAQNHQLSISNTALQTDCASKQEVSSLEPATISKPVSADEPLTQEHLDTVSNQLSNSHPVSRKPAASNIEKKSKRLSEQPQPSMPDHSIIPGSAEIAGIVQSPAIIEITPLETAIEISKEMADKIFTRLNPYEFAIYFRLYRLSYGNVSQSCKVSFTSLAKSAQCDKQTVRRVLRALTQRGLIEIIGVSNEGTTEGGTFFKVNRDFSRPQEPAIKE
jgi:hypothetical protein